MTANPAAAGLRVADLRQLATRACLACGASPAMARSLVEATLSADLHGRPEIGLAHLVDYLDGLLAGRIDGAAEPVIDQPLAAVLRVDGRKGIAQLGFDRGFDQLVAAARACGIALFAQRDTFTVGELGYFARRLAGMGLIALVAANCHAMVATGPGRTAVFGTNPMAFGAPRPAPHPPLVFDQATSATAFVNLARAAKEGTPIPEDWAVDEHGRPTTDPVRALLGALLPFGGTKGANVALMVEVLSAGLAGGAWSLDAGRFHDGAESPRTGLAIIAIAPQALDPHFAVRLEAQLDRLAALGVHIPGGSPRPGPSAPRLATNPAVISRICQFADRKP